MAGCPKGKAWIRLADLVGDRPPLAAWFDLVVKRVAGDRAVAAAFTAGWIADGVVDIPVAAFLAEGRAWPVTPAAISLRRHAEGWCDGVAVGGGPLRVLAGDPAAGLDGVEVMAERATMRAALAAEIVAVLAPVFAAVRARGRFGERAMWGTVADGVVTAAVEMARRGGCVLATAVREAGLLLDGLAEHAPLTVRPRVVDVRWSGGVAAMVRRGTCCLWWRTLPTPDPHGEGSCSSCPLRHPEAQRARWARRLDQEAGAA